MFFEVLIFTFLAIVVGLGLTFFGYAAFRVLLPIISFLGGFWLGMDVATNVLANVPFLGVSLGLLLGFFFGVIFAALAYFMYSVAIIVYGLALGYSLGAGLMLLLGFNYGFLTFMVGVIIAIMMAIAFLNVDMPELYIIALTSFTGASALVAGMLALFGRVPPSELGLSFVQAYIGQSWFWLIVWLLIGIIGFAIQSQMVKAAKSFVPVVYSYESTMKEYSKKSGKKK